MQHGCGAKLLSHPLFIVCLSRLPWRLPLRNNMLIVSCGVKHEVVWGINVAKTIGILQNVAAPICSYSLSRKTVNARENFWNVYCFATNQVRDETAKDNRQTAEWINHDLAFSSTRNL